MAQLPIVVVRRLVYAAIVLASFAGSGGAVTFTEVFYSPGDSDSSTRSLEFVEIFNDSSVVVDLSGAYFSDGISFQMPEDTYLGAGAYLAICADAALVRERLGATNVMGDFVGKLDNGGERIRLLTKTGSPLCDIRYDDRGAWPAAADGTGYSLSLRNPFANVRDPVSWTWSAQPGGTPGEENFPPPREVDHPLLPETGPDAVWRYRKGFDEIAGVMAPFSDPPSAWREAAFDDSPWAEGQTPIGYNETDIVTRLDDMLGKYLAFAARKRFVIEEAAYEELEQLVLTLRIDDGCVAYLNGVEVGRVGLEAPPGTDVPPDAVATASREARGKPVVFLIPKDRVLSGENVIAIQVHNVSLESNDAELAPSIAYRTTVRRPSAPEPSVVFNEVASLGNPTDRFVEILNVLSRPVDMSGYLICGAPALPCYEFPAGTMVESGAFVTVDESALGLDLSIPEPRLVLWAPDARTVVDAVTLDNRPDLPASSRGHCRVPDGNGPWWVTTRPTRGGANAVDVETALVINEIHYNAKLLDAEGRPLPDSTKADFVEIHNRSERPVPLDGYALTAGVHYAFGPGAMLGPRGYIVVARDPAFIRSTYGLSADMVFGPPPTTTADELDAFGTLGGGGDRIRLADPYGNTVDEVAYRDEGDWDERADGGGSSLELIDPRADNSKAMAWGASDESGRAPWTEITFDAVYQANLIPPPQESELHIFLLSEGECLIDDVSVTAGDPPVQYVSNGDFETDTRPWRILGTHVRSFRTTDEAKVGNASLHLVASGPGDNRVNRIEVETTPALRQGPVKVHFWARWLSGSNALHVSGHNNAFGRTVWLPTPQDAGSPGRENGLRRALRQATGSDDLGPVISDLRHEPTVPGDMEPVRILARISDPDGVASATVRWQTDGASAFESEPMRDDGLHGDGRAGDGIFAAELPGQSLRTIVNFYVEATDGAGAASAYPRKSIEHVPLYIVDGPMASKLQRYRLIVNRKNLITPLTGLTTRLLHSDDLVRATFVFEESEAYYDVGIRYHGSPWNRPPDPKMFRVRFNGDKRFQGGAKRINISRYGTAQNEGIAYHLVEKAGVPWAPTPHSPRYQYIAVRFNERPHGTALGEIRPVDQDYTGFNWPHDSGGEAWKITGKLAFNDGGTMQGSPDWTRLKSYTTGPYPGEQSPENYRFYFNPTLRADEDDFGPLIELLETMDRSTTPDAEYEAKIQGILNVESSLRVFAVRSILADWDTVGIGNGQNAYLYFAPREGRHYLLPWDMDHTFERTDVAVVPAASSEGIGRLMSRPVFRRLYASILKELKDSSWSEAHVSQWVQLVNETGSGSGVGTGANNVSFLRTRRTQVESYLRPALATGFAITTPDPTGVPGTTARIEGTAPLDVAHLFALVNGGKPDELEVEWTTPPRQSSAIPTIWQADVEGLGDGENTVEVLALSPAMDIVGSASVRIYDTAGWAAPTLSEISPATGPAAGGTEVTLRGEGFRDHARVLVGSAEATAVIVASPTEIRATTPAGTEGPADVEVINLGGEVASLGGAFRYIGGATFLRGDVDGVVGRSATDVIAILEYLFGAREVSCPDAADANDDGKVNVSDAISLILHLYQGLGPLPEPATAPGLDPTEDDLGCES